MRELERERRVMAVLARRGLDRARYYEESSGMEWLTMEASDVCAAIDTGCDVGDLLTDTGWWDLDDEGPFPDGIRAELEEAAVATDNPA